MSMRDLLSPIEVERREGVATVDGLAAEEVGTRPAGVADLPLERPLIRVASLHPLAPSHTMLGPANPVRPASTTWIY